jgi:hypothetical protein
MTSPTHTFLRLRAEEPRASTLSIPRLLLLGMLASSAACAKYRAAVPADDSARAADQGESASDAGTSAARAPDEACPVDNPYCMEAPPTSVPPSCASVPVELTPLGDGSPDAGLTAALSHSASSQGTCSFSLAGLSDNADRKAVNLYLDGELVPFGVQATEHDGWGWLDPEQTELQLFGDFCEAFKNSRKPSLIVELGCAPVIAI